ncbi:MAG: hypothetical protein IPJ24_15625 [bacterium]|nr:hypothetical protein [bacterium]
MNRKFLTRLLPLVALAVMATACGDDDPAVPGTSAVPDFAVLDVNPASPTGAQVVSPRDYLQKVSAWYFGHAT